MRSAMVSTNGCSPARAHRGSAILLALVAVGVATLLGLSLAATRDANVAASRNLAHAAAARAAAAGAMEVAVDILEDPSTDLAAISNSGGVLFEGLAVGGASAKARVHDLLTGLAADDSSEMVEIVVEGTSSGISQTARAVGRLPRALGAPTADLDCSEFALLATGTLIFESDACLAVWSGSPLAILAEPVAYGLASGSSAQIAVSPDASLHGTVALSVGGFATDAEMHNEHLADKVVRIPAAIHVPLAAVPIERTTEGRGGGAPDTLLDGYIAYDAMPEGDMRVPARAAATLRGVRDFDVAGNLFIERGAHLRVEGETRFVVRGNLVVEPATVEVAAGATLSFIVLGDASIDGAYVGGERSNLKEIRDATGRAAYDGGASRVLVSLAGGGRVSISEGSVVKGEIYAPEAAIAVATRSAVYGRVLGRDVRLGAGCAVFYDPALDKRSGWTARASGIWTPTGTVRAEVRQIARLDGESLERFAVDTGVVPVVSTSFGSLLVTANEEIAEGRPAQGDGGIAGDPRQPRDRASVRVTRGLLRAIEARRTSGRSVFLRGEDVDKLKRLKDLDRAFVSRGFDPMKGADE